MGNERILEPAFMQTVTEWKDLDAWRVFGELPEPRAENRPTLPEAGVLLECRVIGEC